MTPLDLKGPLGRLEALLEEPADARGVGPTGLVEAGRGERLKAAVVFAHPHPQMGGTMHTKVVYHASKALSRIGCAVLRFNFRGAGKSDGVFDNGVGEQDDVRAALAFMRDRYPDAPLWAGGMSFGGYVGLTAAAAEPDVSALIGIALPLSRYDFSAVQESPKAKFFILGERDDICSVKEMRQFYAHAAEPKELVVIDGADHLFEGKVTDVADAIEDLLGDWHG